MKYLTISSTFGAIAVAGFMSTLPANAQATRTWVSGVGDDANPCSRTAPCKTFAGAISKTATAGEINCLDPGGFGAVTITKSITISCEAGTAGVLVSGTNAIIVNDSGSGTPNTAVVMLKGLDFEGLTTGLNGVLFSSGGVLRVEDCVFRNFKGASPNGNAIKVATAAASQTSISRVTAFNNGNGVTVAPTAGVANVAISQFAAVRNGNGVAVAANQQVMVDRSQFSGNTTSGVEADPSGVLSVSNSVINGNTTGVTAGAGATVRLSNNDIGFNGTGITGATTSFGNNRIYPSVGTSPTPAGGASNGLGTL